MAFPDESSSGITSDASKGDFKSANNLGHLPSGGAGLEAGGNQIRKAQIYSTRHSTKGLAGPKPFTAKLKPVLNEGKAIGRKRGY